MPFDITRIAHVNYRIPQGAEDKAQDFWCGILGFSPLRKPPGNNHAGRWFTHGNYEVHVSPDLDFTPVASAHNAYVVEGILDLAQQLKDAGITVRPGLGTTEDLESFFIDDPFGNRVEFMTPAAANVGLPPE